MRTKLTFPESRVLASMDVKRFTSAEEMQKIAQSMDLSVRTLRAYRSSVRVKLGITADPVPPAGRAAKRPPAAKPTREGVAGRLSYLSTARKDRLPRCPCGLLLPCYHEPLPTRRASE